jgi:hypothetical protein
MPRFLLVLACMAAAGCATVSTMKEAPPYGEVARSYSGDFTRVVEAARDSLLELGLTIEDFSQVNDRCWRIVATAGMSAFSWGELVRVLVERRQAAEVEVRVLTRRRLATNIFAKGDYAPDIYPRMDWKLRRPTDAPRSPWVQSPLSPSH